MAARSAGSSTTGTTTTGTTTTSTHWSVLLPFHAVIWRRLVARLAEEATSSAGRAPTPP